MMKYRIIFTDLDGTLITDQSTRISQRTAEALKRALDAGIHVVPTTGRPLKLIPGVFFEISDYMILVNGSIIYDVRAKQILVHNPIDYRTVLRILEHLRERSLHFYVADGFDRYTDSDSYAYFRDVLGYQYLVNDMNPQADLLERIEREHLGIDKISIYLDPEDRQKCIDELTAMFPEVEVSGSAFDNIELNSIHAGKGNALRELCRRLDISLDDAIAFGDSDNDLEMLSTVKTSVVPENGNEKAKKQATYICASCEDDGPASFIEDFL